VTPHVPDLALPGHSQMDILDFERGGKAQDYNASQHLARGFVFGPPKDDDIALESGRVLASTFSIEVG
jgi:hypothetical protein